MAIAGVPIDGAKIESTGSRISCGLAKHGESKCNVKYLSKSSLMPKATSFRVARMSLAELIVRSFRIDAVDVENSG